MCKTDINVITFNCEGVVRSILCVKALCERVDILALQETWLTKKTLPLLKNIHQDFQSVGVVPTRPPEKQGRPQGGVAILWKKQLSVEKLQFKSDRVIGIKVLNISIISIYLPVKGKNNIELFSNILDEIETTLQNQRVEHYLIVGDFNIGFPNNTISIDEKVHTHEKKLKEFCLNLNAQCVDAKDLPKDTFSFIHNNHKTRSWLDHCLMSKNISELNREVNVIYDLFVSDHFPLEIKINLNEKEGFKEKSDKIFKKETTEIDIANRCGTCIIENCESNTANIDNSRSEVHYHKLKEYVEDARVKARKCFEIWHEQGLPSKNSDRFKNMFESRLVFKQLFSMLYTRKSAKANFYREHFNIEIADLTDQDNKNRMRKKRINFPSNNPSDAESLSSAKLVNDEKPSTSHPISPRVVPKNLASNSGDQEPSSSQIRSSELISQKQSRTKSNKSSIDSNEKSVVFEGEYYESFLINRDALFSVSPFIRSSKNDSENSNGSSRSQSSLQTSDEESPDETDNKNKMRKKRINFPSNNPSDAESLSSAKLVNDEKPSTSHPISPRVVPKNLATNSGDQEPSSSQIRSSELISQKQSRTKSNKSSIDSNEKSVVFEGEYYESFLINRDALFSVSPFSRSSKNDSENSNGSSRSQSSLQTSDEESPDETDSSHTGNINGDDDNDDDNNKDKKTPSKSSDFDSAVDTLPLDTKTSKNTLEIKCNEYTSDESLNSTDNDINESHKVFSENVEPKPVSEELPLSFNQSTSKHWTTSYETLQLLQEMSNIESRKLEESRPRGKYELQNSPELQESYKQLTQLLESDLRLSEDSESEENKPATEKIPPSVIQNDYSTYTMGQSQLTTGSFQGFDKSKLHVDYDEKKMEIDSNNTSNTDDEEL